MNQEKMNETRAAWVAMVAQRFVEKNSSRFVSVFEIEDYCQKVARELRQLRSVMGLAKAREVLGVNFLNSYYEDVITTRQAASELFTAIDEIYSKRDAKIAEEEYEGLRLLTQRESEVPNV